MYTKLVCHCTKQKKQKKYLHHRTKSVTLRWLPGGAGEGEQVDRGVHDHAGGRAAAVARVRAVLRQSGALAGRHRERAAQRPRAQGPTGGAQGAARQVQGG